MSASSHLDDRPSAFTSAAILRFSHCNAAMLAGRRFFFALSATSLAIMAIHPASAQQYGSGAYGSSYTGSSSGYAQPQAQQPQYGTQDAGQIPEDENQTQLSDAPSQALTAAQLEQLLAPVALYPDQLLAQVLTAATYPAQVAAADQWLKSMRAQGYGSDQIASGADSQTGWDPSIKALTAFPDVLDNLNSNLSWTTALGNAYYNQPQDVMQTVQVLRERAQSAGNLQTTPQETVSDDQGYVGIQPANPEVVYVPVYNPWVVYGTPVAPYAGFSFFGALANFFGMGVQYGPDFAMAAFDRTPFGLLAWGLDWLADAVLFHHDDYWTRSTTVADWGLPYGGRRYRAGLAFNRAGAGNYRSGARYRIGTNWNRSNWNRSGNAHTRSSDGGTSRLEPARDWASRNSSQRFPEPRSLARSQAYENRGQSFNRALGNTGTAQSFVRPAYHFGESRQPVQNYAARPGQNLALRQENLAPRAYTTRPGFSYANPSPVYRGASPQAARTFSEPRSFAPAGAQRFAGNNNRELKSFAAPKSFGGARAPREFGGNRSFKGFGGGKPPKAFGGGKAPKGFGGGKAPKAGHEGGHHGRH